MNQFPITHKKNGIHRSSWFVAVI